MSKSTWQIVEWTASHGSVAKLNATVPIDVKGRQRVTYSIAFGDGDAIEISARDAKILIAAKAAK